MRFLDMQYLAAFMPLELHMPRVKLVYGYDQNQGLTGCRFSFVAYLNYLNQDTCGLLMIYVFTSGF